MVAAGGASGVFTIWSLHLNYSVTTISQHHHRGNIKAVNFSVSHYRTSNDEGARGEAILVIPLLHVHAGIFFDMVKHGLGLFSEPSRRG